MYQILGISGSLRAGSHNTALLEATRAHLPDAWALDIAVPRDFPVYEQSLQQQGWPTVVTALAQQIQRADLVLIATPEYNYSIPGGLKNAIDWISRLPDAPFRNKPVAVLGASSGRLGTVRAQLHLRQCLQFLESRVLSRPEVFVGAADQAFQDGRLVDEGSQVALQAFMAACLAMAVPGHAA